MKKFMDQDFLLSNEAAKISYITIHASKCLYLIIIVTYPAVEIAEDKKYENITQMWLYEIIISGEQ